MITLNSLDAFLSQHYPMLGKRLKQEFYYRVGAEPETSLSINLEGAVREYVNELLSSEKGFVHSFGDSLLASPIELRHLQNEPRRYHSISEAVRTVIIERARLERLNARRRQLLDRVTHALESTEQTLREMKSGAEHSSRSERYTEIAQAIQQSAHLMQKGATTLHVILADEERDVELDPELSAHENAVQYFERAKRSKESQQELKVRLQSAIRELPRLQGLLERVRNAEEPRELERAEKEAESVLGGAVSNQERARNSTDPLSAFRRFIVYGGFTVLVGKNAKQNDELTLHVAKKEDIWLHARDVSGSHVVLQTAHSKKSVPKEAIEQAAEIAAHFSDAKTQTIAPVSFTKKKYVRKPKGAPPGAVMVDREEVVLVKPQLRKSQE